MNWLKKIFRQKEKQFPKVSTVREFRERELSENRKQTDQEFYNLYFNHPPVESYSPSVDNDLINEGTNSHQDNSYGHGGHFGGGGASASWDDNNSSDISSWSDSSSSDSSSYDSGSSDSSSNDW